MNIEFSKYIDLLPSPNNLVLHFDPVLYSGLGNKRDLGYPQALSFIPWYLKEFRDYNIGDVIPTYPLSQQRIQGAPMGATKARLINNTLSYIKDPNNNDVELKRFPYNYDSISQSFTENGFYPPIENKNPLLILKKDDINSPVYTYGFNTASTLNIFVRLQRPISHKNPNSPTYLVREKKGIFCTYNVGYQGGFFIGYRSPHHWINGDRTYKCKFEPFSFVFGLGTAYSSSFGPDRFIYQTLMTDFKFKFGEMYMLTVVSSGTGNVFIYVNGERQEIANVPFNPIRRSTSTGGGARTHLDRLGESPLGPNFIKKDGTTYPSYQYQTLEAAMPSLSSSAFVFGKPNNNGYQITLPYGQDQKYQRSTKQRKRFLNNLDLGVINTYNIALSQTQITQLYENFRYRYK